MEKTFNRNVWVDYLRSALTVLVVAHHASLAYTTFARFDSEAYIRSTHPIVDTKRWVGLDVFENFNDVFFMSLMFLIGGLFLHKSIKKKGGFVFIKDRLYRLFMPFLILGTGLMLIAYFPAFYIDKSSINLADYIIDFFTVEQWPVGPPWFIWLLFVFNVLLVLLNPLIKMISNLMREYLNALTNKPLLLFLIWWLITWVLYVPLAYKVGAGTWTGLGPFDFQLSRILLYFGYFLTGVAIGTTDFNHKLFSLSSPVVASWGQWVILALSAYSVLTITERYEVLANMVKSNQLDEPIAWMLYFTIYTCSCTLSCIAFIATFRRFVSSSYQWWDSLVQNAYLIYLTHYTFLIWIQFLLMPLNLPAFVKFLIAFASTLVLSWGFSSLLRKIPIINRYL